MLSRRGLSVGCLLALAALVACHDLPTGSQTPGPRSSLCLTCVSGGGGGGGGGTTRTLNTDSTLSVSITGYSRVTTDSAVYTAQVSNASGPFYYYWLFKPCFRTSSSSVSCVDDYTELAEGAGKRSVVVRFKSNTAWVNVDVQLRQDSGSKYWTGEGYKMVLGPAALQDQGPQATSSCAINQQFFPFQQMDMSSGDTTGVDFRLKPCSSDVVTN